MEANSLIQNHQKKQQLNEEQDIDANSKCLGNLPEKILRHILSFLPTEDAVRTSVLCKRWEYLWTSIPNLDCCKRGEYLWSSFPNFEDFVRSLPAKRMLLMNFVDRALCLRNSSDIKRFTLCCDVRSDASRVITWISAVVRHNVQELCIELDNFEGAFQLPCCLFTCKTLTRLDLDMSYIKNDVSYILKLPTTICFSNLKILAIQNVTFSDEYLTQQLFSSLPVLEKLELIGCSWRGLKVVRISTPKLYFLAIQDYESRYSSYGYGCHVMIFAVSLKGFYYRGHLFPNYCLYNSFSLEKAEIYAYPDNTSEFPHSMYKLLTGLSNVKFLLLHSEVVQVLIYTTELLPHMPMFNNLMDLVFDGTSVVIDFEALLMILQRSPCLENLKILGGIRLTSNCEENDRILDPVSPCFLSHLKCIEVGSYQGAKYELSAIKILLKNSVVLEEIVITCSVYFSWDLEKQENIYKQVRELPRGSQNCKIVFK